ncbi:CoA transferase [Salinirubellus salinus]|uniref:CoA transferase n=1 Tax=Salinirubellus salinus TaxID=1364945 RepID=A0A9E7R2E6_9EURY|nr:CaiB/BaiF CoA-transferase family protein [Salinirubellus salinus]UWM54515.1 CoA transferase [Salinirubellus salinus]
MTTKPLADVSVLELSTMIAGPYAGQLLGDLGADVVKLERPETGELARSLEPRVGGAAGESFYYLTANRNKRSLALDVTTDEGRELFLELVEAADVVLENFPPTFTDRYDIGYETAREHNEQIVYCSISAYGETGPYREFPGIDTTVQALGGAMSMTRDGDSGPMRSGVPMNDVFAALYAVQGILTALYARDRTGEGEFVDVSLLDAGLAGLTTRATYSFATGEPYPPFGRRHNYFAPEGVYEVADGAVQLSVVTDRHWRAFCEAVDAPALAADERFAEVNERVANREALEAELTAVLERWDASDLVAALREAGVPAAPINDTVSVWDDPQVEARQMRRTLDHPTAGEVETLGFPVKYERAEPSVDRHPPRLGEHSRAVLEEVGLDDTAIERLVAAGVVGELDEA